MAKIITLAKKDEIWQNKFLQKKSKINLKRRRKDILNYCDYVSMPNIISKSNYFLPVQDVDKYYIPTKEDIFEPLIVLSHKGESQVSLSYMGHRGNMWDFILFARLLNEADSGNLTLTLYEKDLRELLNVDQTNTWFAQRIKHSFFKFKTTTFGINFPYQNDTYQGMFNLAAEVVYPKDEKTNHSNIYHIAFTDMLKKTAALDYFNNVDLQLLESEALRRKYQAAKLYTFLCAHEKECRISLEDMVSLINPNVTNIKNFISHLKNRAIEPLNQIGFLNKDKINYDRRTRCFWFKEGSFTSRNKHHVGTRRRLMELKLKRRSKAVRVRKKNGFKKMQETPAGSKILPRLKHRKDVMDIFDYWDSLGLHKHKNRESNIFLKGMKYLSSAIEGTLYLKTKYEEYNTIFAPKYIKKAIQTFQTKTFDHNYLPKNKTYLQKLPLAYFMLPSDYTKDKIAMPEFIQCYKGVITPVVQPLDDIEIKFFLGSFAKYSNKNISDLTPKEHANIIKAFNILYEEGFIEKHHKSMVTSDPNILYRTVITGLSQIFDKKITADDLVSIKAKNKYSNLLNSYIKKNGYNYQ